MKRLEAVDGTDLQVQRSSEKACHGRAHVEVAFDAIRLTDPRWVGAFEPARLLLSRADAQALAEALLEAAEPTCERCSETAELEPTTYLCGCEAYRGKGLCAECRSSAEERECHACAMRAESGVQRRKYGGG